MTKTNVQSTPSNSQHHDTPNNKTHVIKFRVTAEEKTSLELTCKLLNLSLSTFIRHALHNAKIERTVVCLLYTSSSSCSLGSPLYSLFTIPLAFFDVPDIKACDDHPRHHGSHEPVV